MTEYSTGEAQWLMDSNRQSQTEDPTRSGSRSNQLENENAACWIAVFVLLIVVACSSTAVAFYDHSIRWWPRSSPSVPSRRDTARAALVSLNANMTTTFAQPPPSSLKQPYCQTTVLLLRHCDDHGLFAKEDREDGDKHCSHLGFQRTRYLPTLFGTRWPPPQALYALVPPSQNHGINYRQIEMLLPLAEQEDLSIHVVREPPQVARAVFDHLLQQTNDVFHQRTCRQDDVIVVAWKHAYIPNVAAELGCGPDQGCPDRYPDDSFDLVWELRFVFAPQRPKDEIMEALRASKSSFLIVQDDYGLLQKATTNPDDDEDPSSASEPQWTVFGSVTEQRFDPLAFDYNGEQGREVKEMDL